MLVRALLISLSLSFLSLGSNTLAAEEPLSLPLIMQHPDWIGPPVESAWWQLDDDSLNYLIKRPDSTVRDVYRLPTDGDFAWELGLDDLEGVDGPNPVLSPGGDLALSIHRGSLLLRALETGELRRLYTGSEPVDKAHFSPSGDAVFFRSAKQWWRMVPGGGAASPITRLSFEDAEFAQADDELEKDQLRLFSTLERARAFSEERHDEDVERAIESPQLGAAVWYLGSEHELVNSELSADGRWLLAVVSEIKDKADQADKMPHYVARSGYVDIEDVRPLVGRDDPHPSELWLLDLESREKIEIDLAKLDGRDEDPLEALKKAQDIEPHNDDDLRPVQVGDIVWHPQLAEALIRVNSIDNKDRWTLRMAAADGDAKLIHRLSDEAWVNDWVFNEMGWVPGTDTAWLLSEEDGFSHLYTISQRGRQRQLTDGEFEVFGIRYSRFGESVFFLSNREHPTRYDLYRMNLSDGAIAQVSELGGVESFALHPSEGLVLLLQSQSYVPTQATVLNIATSDEVAATDTRTDEYLVREWQAPEIVAVPSSHVEAPIWSKFYPARGDFSGPRPAVLFVHGAGYTQNTHHKFPYYFREQMFHNLLTERGFHVLDMDYRASQGYGRDWRTAIYRQMGTPELEDLLDGVAWLVEEHNIDPERVGIYGGSYGGFMTFMAMFKAPEVFAAGASLRPVTDWRHYNHGYTSGILNTPQVDPEAHHRSSPIEFVEGLQGDLLISHGMLDDNVFYKDSVRLVQRLIELEKENWELASYPLEPHGYIHPESWLDQYRRIYKLFDRSLGDTQ